MERRCYNFRDFECLFNTTVDFCTRSVVKYVTQSFFFSFFQELKAEIERLKLSQTEGNLEISAKALAEVALLRDKLKETQHLLAESTR